MNQFKKVAFYTLGCKLNFSETSTISRLFEDAGIAKVNFEEQPDIYVTTKDAFTLTDGPTIFLAENVEKVAKFCIQQANIPAKVMEDINKKAFSNLVETFVRTHRDTNYIDAIIQVCEDNEIDLRDSKKLISKEIIEHVEFEAKELNLLQGGNPTYVLPI